MTYTAMSDGSFLQCQHTVGMTFKHDISLCNNEFASTLAKWLCLDCTYEILFIGTNDIVLTEMIIFDSVIKNTSEQFAEQKSIFAFYSHAIDYVKVYGLNVNTVSLDCFSLIL